MKPFYPIKRPKQLDPQVTIENPERETHNKSDPTPNNPESQMMKGTAPAAADTF